MYIHPSRLYRCTTLAILLGALSVFAPGTARADAGTPGCTNGIGNAAQLAADVAAMNQNGEADTIFLDAGCIYDIPSTLVIEADQSLAIEGNGATISGGLLHRVIEVRPGAVLTVNNTVVRDGKATSGAGLLIDGGTVTLNGSLVTQNTATLEDGGGIAVLSGSLTLSHSIVIHNHALKRAGGLSNAGATTLIHSSILGNDASNGGGIDNTGILTLNYSTVALNAAESSGGGISHFGETASLIVSGSTISENVSEIGGGISVSGRAAATITDSTLFENQATTSYGGAIFSGSNSRLTISSSTLFANSAGVGGGLLIAQDGLVTLTNTIIAGSTNGGDCSSAGTIDAPARNFIGDGSCSIPDALSGDPLLGLPTGEPAYMPLLPGSPAIDAGTLCPTTDQRGAMRPQDGDGDRVALCDLGAYEADGVEPAFAFLLSNGSVDQDSNGDKIPDSWTIQNKSGDKLDCSGAHSADGNCAFAFKGSAAENSKLRQSIDPSSAAFFAGDILALQVLFKGGSASRIHCLIDVRYSDAPPSRVVRKFKPTAVYQIFSAELTLASAAVEQISVTVRNKSKAGRVYMDLASVVLVPSGSPTAAPLPLPAAPGGFRRSH